MKRSKGRTIAALAGCAVVVVVVLGLAFWKELGAQYYLFRLRRNPDSLFQVIQAEKGSPKYLAVTQYLQAQAGRQHLFETCFDAVSVEVRQMVSSQRGALDSQFWERIIRLESVREATFGLVRDSYFFAYRNEGGSGSFRNRLEDTDNHKFFRSTKRFLPLLFGHRFTSERFPNHQFTFVPADEACKTVGFYGGFYADGHIGRTTTTIFDFQTAGLPNGITEKDMEIMKSGIALLIESNAGEGKTEKQEPEIDRTIYQGEFKPSQR